MTFGLKTFLMKRQTHGLSRSGIQLLMAIIIVLSISLCTPNAWACSSDGECTKPEECQGGVCQLKEGTCTDNDAYKVPSQDQIDSIKAGNGLVSSIVKNIKDILAPKDGTSLAESIFSGISSDTGFQNDLRAASTIFVLIYGVLFMFGMVQITALDLVIRLAKLGIVNALVNGTAWNYFNNTLVHLFNDGTDQLINKLTSITVNAPDGSVVMGGGGTVATFSGLDYAIVKVTSAKMAITLMAAFTTGPYGPIIGIILLMSLGSFLKSLMNALWVYIMSLVLRTLLFGMAPIFLSFLLFSRTRHLFDGWINQLVNTSLQPVFLFTFFAFFVKLLSSEIDLLVSNGSMPVCWVAAPGVTGSTSSFDMWRFALKCGGVWTPFDGDWDFNGPVLDASTSNCDKPVNPIGILLPLTMWIVADLASRFNHIVIEIAKDIANATTELRPGGESLLNWAKGAGAGGSSGPATPTAVPAPPAGGGGAPAAGGGAGGRMPPAASTAPDPGRR